MKNLQLRTTLLCLAMAAAGAIPAHAITYANITAVTPRMLTNGEQILVQSDGVLDFQMVTEDGRAQRSFGGSSGGTGSLIDLKFPNARSALSSNYINVAEYPVSYIQVQIPQDATNGVGVEMKVAMFTPSSYSVTASPDQQSVIITVNSERTLAQTRPVAGGKAGPAVEGSSSIDVAPDGTVRVQAVAADIHEVLAHLARLTGMNISVDDRVNRKVSLSLSGLAPDAVLTAVANGYGLALSRVDGVYMVSEGVPTDLATYHLSGTASFPMSNIEAQTASGLLPTFLFQYLHVNPGQNAVVVTAPDQMLTKIGADLARLDQQPPLVEVDALAVEFADTHDEDESLGVKLHRGDRTTSFDTASGLLQYQTIGKLPYSFAVNLNALIQKGKAQIRANPRLAVVNGRTADLFIGDEKYIQVQFNSYGGLQTKIEGVDVGTHLSVTPWTGGNGEITTHIVPEVSNISEIDLQTGLPVLSDRKADTTVRVKDGDTIVIGGLVQKQRYVTNGKIPLLGDLPLIGPLFRSRKVSIAHTELVIFITPHILDTHGQVPNETPARKALENTLLHTMENDTTAPAAKPVK